MSLSGGGGYNFLQFHCKAVTTATTKGSMVGIKEDSIWSTEKGPVAAC